MYHVEVLVEDYEFEVSGASEVQVLLRGVAQARNRLNSCTFSVVKIDLRDDLPRLRIPRVQALVIIRDKCAIFVKNVRIYVYETYLIFSFKKMSLMRVVWPS